MRRIFQRFHEWAARSSVLRQDDLILGELVLNESCWQCCIETKQGRITLSIGGKFEPDQRLLETARKTAQHLDPFCETVSSFLAESSRQKCWQQFSAEILSLKVESINYWWPKTPQAGMIFFHGPNELHLWHCDFTDCNFDGLAFDS